MLLQRLYNIHDKDTFLFCQFIQCISIFTRLLLNTAGIPLSAYQVIQGNVECIGNQDGIADGRTFPAVYIFGQLAAALGLPLNDVISPVYYPFSFAVRRNERKEVRCPLVNIIHELPVFFGGLPIPLPMVFALIFFFGTIISGSNAIIPLCMPMAMAAMPDAGVPLLVLLMSSAYEPCRYPLPMYACSLPRNALRWISALW